MGPSLRMKGRTAGQLVSSLSLLTVFLLVALLGAEGRVILMHKNESVSFGSREASFAPQVPGSGICGFLFSGKPLNACSTFQDKASFFDGPCSPFVLVVRGNCSFETKIRHAQDAGFGAVIVFDDEDGDDLVAMAGNWEGIWIYAVFVSKAAAQELSHYSGDFNTECWILPANEIIPLSNGIVMAISLFAVALMCGTCLIFRLNRGHHGDGGQLIHEESYGISNQIVKAMPTVIFKGTADVNGTVDTCTICLEDYEAGAKLRILPCHHRFHVFCIDPWLTKWRPFCPLCKRDARVDFNNPPASESTPLLNSLVLGQQVSTAGGGDIQASAPQALPIQIPHHLSDTNLGSVHSLSPSQNVQVVSSHRLTPHSTSLCNLSPMVAPDASRHPSLQSLGGCKPSALSTADLGSLEAFRASLYFTPPSLFRRPSASYLPEHFGGSCNSTPQASDCHLATSFV